MRSTTVTSMTTSPETTAPGAGEENETSGLKVSRANCGGDGGGKSVGPLSLPQAAKTEITTAETRTWAKTASLELFDMGSLLMKLWDSRQYPIPPSFERQALT